MAQVTGKKVATTPMPTPTGTSGAIIDSFNTQDDQTVNAPSIHIVKDALTTINDNLTQLAVGKRTALNLSGYTAASLLDSVSNDTAIWMTYSNTAQRLSDLPINSGGAYIIFNTYTRALLFLGYNGDVYYYMGGGGGWHQLH